MPISFGCVLRVFSIKVSHVENDSIMPCTCNNFLLKVDGKIHLCILAHLIVILVGELVLYVTPCLIDAFASLITIFWTDHPSRYWCWSITLYWVDDKEFMTNPVS